MKFLIALAETGVVKWILKAEKIFAKRGTNSMYVEDAGKNTDVWMCRLT